MQPVPNIRRTPDGAIDYDFYRAKASALRARALRDTFKRASAGFKSAAAALAALFAIRRV